jgi:serine phosphatase RsbU (regulator of sigma subunit)
LIIPNRSFIFAFLFLSSLFSYSQKKEVMDSLNRYINAAINDTDRVLRINRIYFDELWRYNSAEPYTMLKQALSLSIKENYLRGKMITYKNMAGYSRNKGHRQNVIKYSGEYLKAALLTRDSLSIAGAISNMGMDLRNEGKPAEALEMHLQTLGIYQRRGATGDQIARAYSQVASDYQNLGKDSLAIPYAKRALRLREEINYADGIDASLQQIANLYRSQKNYEKIIEYTEIALKNRMESSDSGRIAVLKSMIAEAQIMLGNKTEALRNIYSALGISDRHGSDFDTRSVYSVASMVFENTGDCKKALGYLKIARTKQDSITRIENSVSMSKAQVLFDVEEKENQIMVLDQQKKIQEQDIKMQRYGLILGAIVLLTVIVVSFSIYGAYRQKKEANARLAEQKKTIEEKNKEVMDSINYARRLQNAILLPEAEIAKYFSSVFILYKPRDIVSGDFYWFSESASNKIIAVADCTGHGVPGGFMSMLGYECLQDVVLKEHITTTAEALKSLDRKITESLNKSDKSFRDGMDISLCAFSKKENVLQYSGANRPLLHISGGELTEYKPDKNTIGGDIDNIEKNYSTQNIPFKKGDRFYMFTDGYADQFGGDKGRKFKYKNLQQALLDTSAQSMPEQKSSLEKIFNSWKGNLEQLDDVCIIGIEV